MVTTAQAPAPVVNRRAGLTVSEVHRRLREMVIVFHIKPGEKINEGELAEQLGVSRTPLREALHRLVAENMLTLIPNRGFYGRKLERQEVFDLYELRQGVELTAVRLALKRASQEDLMSLRESWLDVMRRAADLSTQELLIEDEQFHIALARLSGNQEIVHTLQTLNARIHFFRWSDLEGASEDTEEQHLALVDALLARDERLAERLITTHITRRMDEIVSFIQSGVIRLYAGNF